MQRKTRKTRKSFKTSSQESKTSEKAEGSPALRVRNNINNGGIHHNRMYTILTLIKVVYFLKICMIFNNLGKGYARLSRNPPKGFRGNRISPFWLLSRSRNSPHFFLATRDIFFRQTRPFWSFFFELEIRHIWSPPIWRVYVILIIYRIG